MDVGASDGVYVPMLQVASDGRVSCLVEVGCVRSLEKSCSMQPARRGYGRPAE